MKILKLVIITVLTAFILTACPEPASDPEPVTYALLDTGPAGGLIFYDDTIGYDFDEDSTIQADEKNLMADKRYLEAAPVSTEWASYKQWGSLGTFIGVTGTAIGEGIFNTPTIVAWLDTNIDDTNGDVTNKTERAAYLCNTLSVVNGGVTYADWFLPSQDELNLMFRNLDQQSVGGFVDDIYWSSSEHSDDGAFSQFFTSGNQGANYKYMNYKVRAVRTF